MDISSRAIEESQLRVGEFARYAISLVRDITAIGLPMHHNDVRHDRAVFHFLTEPEQREAYVVWSKYSSAQAAY